MAIKDILIYVGQVALSIGGFYILYQLFFKAGHHFRFNRIMILLVVSFSFVFPFVSLDLHQMPLEPINQFDFQQITDFWEADAVESNDVVIKPGSHPFDPFLWMFLLYSFGAILFTIRYIIKLSSITKLIRQNELIKRDNYFYVKLKEGQPTFSFRDYIFTDQRSLTDENKAMFIHEQCHVDQKHTYDLLLVELLLIAQWFNPFIYLFKNRLAEVHEFLADDHVMQNGCDRMDYQRLLFASVSRNSGFDFTSHFGSNLKKRIIIMNRNKTIKLNAWKTVFPFLFGATIIILHSGFNNQNPGIPLIDSANIFTDNANIIETKTDPVFHHPIKKDSLIRLASGFGMRMHPILKTKKMHNGIDYSANIGVNIHASARGVVREAGLKGPYGNMVIIDHGNGFSSGYAHMASISVQAGDRVSADQIIGTVGNTGLSMAPHLHFEIMKNGEYVNPIDYLEQEVPTSDLGALD